ncbi:hypothetical protein ACFX11_031862 [Malus domestica]
MTTNLEMGDLEVFTGVSSGMDHNFQELVDLPFAENHRRVTAGELTAFDRLDPPNSMATTNGASPRAADAENSLEKIKRQLASSLGRNLLQGPLLKQESRDT